MLYKNTKIVWIKFDNITTLRADEISNFAFDTFLWYNKLYSLDTYIPKPLSNDISNAKKEKHDI